MAGDLQDHLTEPEHSRLMLRMRNGKSLFAVDVRSTLNILLTLLIGQFSC
jgi:hypothetical protein